MHQKPAGFDISDYNLPFVAIIAIVSILIGLYFSSKTKWFSTRKANSDNLTNSEKLVQYGKPYLDALEAYRKDIEDEKGDRQEIERAYNASRHKVNRYFNKSTTAHVAAVDTLLNEIKADLATIRSFKGSFINNKHPGVHDRVGEKRVELEEHTEALRDMLEDPKQVVKV